MASVDAQFEAEVGTLGLDLEGEPEGPGMATFEPFDPHELHAIDEEARSEQEDWAPLTFDQIEGPNYWGYFYHGGRKVMRVEVGIPKEDTMKVRCYRHPNCYKLHPVAKDPGREALLRWLYATPPVPVHARPGEAAALTEAHRTLFEERFCTYKRKR